MSFYFCDKYINTDCDDKYIERAMFEVVPLFWGFNDRYGYEARESDLEDLFSYFSLKTEKNAFMPDLSWMEKLIIGGEIIIDYVDIGLSCKTFFCTRYAPPVHSSESDCREPNFEQELEPKSQPITNTFTAKVEIDPGLSS